MANTNYIGSIVKIVENPRYTIFSNTIPITKFRVHFPQLRNTRIINLIFWGQLARDVSKYYQINDYILIEGYVSLSLNKNNYGSTINKNLKKIEITVLKIYPFLLNQSYEIRRKY